MNAPINNRKCVSCWWVATRYSAYIATSLAVVAVWVVLSYLTVTAADKVNDYGHRKADDVRLWALGKLDATPAVFITAPASQASIDTILEAECRKQNVSVDLVRALIQVESAFKQDAIAFNPEGDSKYGKMRSAAHSYMQVRGVWAGSTVCPNVKSWADLYKPELNIECGIHILKLALATQPSLKLALAEYNGGSQCISKGNIICAESRNHSSLVMENVAEIIWRKSNVR